MESFENVNIAKEAQHIYYIDNMFDLSVPEKSGPQHNAGSLGTCDTGATGATLDAAQNAADLRAKQQDEAI